MNSYGCVKYNQSKTEILEIINELGEATSIEIAELTGKRYENCGMLMLSYHRFGLLNRRKLKGVKTFAYSLSARGLERLGWLRAGES